MTASKWRVFGRLCRYAASLKGRPLLVDDIQGSAHGQGMIRGNQLAGTSGVGGVTYDAPRDK
jgi:hypothetical protein